MSAEDFTRATYVEGVVISRQVTWPQEHAWIVFNGEIIDPTLPDMELHYFPAHQWTGDDFLRVHFRYKDKPFFRHVEFMTKGVQVEMDKARKKAKKHALAWCEPTTHR